MPSLRNDFPLQWSLPQLLHGSIACTHRLPTVSLPKTGVWLPASTD